MSALRALVKNPFKESFYDTLYHFSIFINIYYFKNIMFPVASNVM